MANQTETEDGCTFYDDARSYWSNIPATVDGMLGGYSQISSTDIATSKRFLKPLIQGAGAVTKNTYALDCGAGIGRVSKYLLLPLFNKVDLVELNQDFLNEAAVYLENKSSRVGQYICHGLESFQPEKGRYDVIWCQWVLGHLTDDDLTAFFKRCVSGLTENGLILVKENFTGTDEVEMDDNDSSVTRPKEHFMSIVDAANLSIIKEEKQKNFPKDIYEVRLFALEPKVR